jgi:DNA polymerase-4
MITTTRTILHLDLDAFFCAVEELHDPSLRGKPFAVGGRPDQRGVVASCSYPARQRGVRSAMPTARALRICPELRMLPSRHGVYHQHSEKVMGILRQLTRQFEQISIDEAFVDISDLLAPHSGSAHPDELQLAYKLAQSLQARIYADLNLPCSIGIASNKLVAKIATDIGKASAHSSGAPMAITIVPAGDEAAFLAPLPVETLWGVGPKTAERLEEIGVLTIGELAHKPPAELIRLFGKNGLELSQHARGSDDRPIITFHEPKSISQETTFSRDLQDRQNLLNTLQEQSQQVSQRLKSAQRFGATVKIKVRWPDFTSLTRQITLSQPTQEAEQIYQAAVILFDQVWSAGRAVRLLGVGVSNLTPSVRQLSLFEQPSATHTEKQRKLQAAMQTLRERYGENILHPASQLHPQTKKGSV